MNITLLQWNIWYKEDIENIAKLLLDYKPDIVCLQELTRGFSEQNNIDTPQYIADKLGYDYFYEEMPLEDSGQNYTQANAIFSHFPIIGNTSSWINMPTGTGHYDDEHRAYVEVTLDVNGEQITVATTHMSYTSGFVETPRKRQETDKLVDLIKKHERNYIISGDFNATNDSYTVAKILDQLIDLGPDNAAKTWTTKPFSYDGFVENELKWRLDYVFATPDVQKIMSEVIDTEFSDHLPILTNIKISNK